jgi:hypothetical protein
MDDSKEALWENHLVPRKVLQKEYPKVSYWVHL